MTFIVQGGFISVRAHCLLILIVAYAQDFVSYDYAMFAGADQSEHSLVELDSRVNVKRLPPPPLKGLVKGESEG